VTRRLTLAMVALLALHVTLAWFTLQAAFLFVELVWRTVAGRDELRPLLASHVDQFRVLRLLQGALWLVTAAVFVPWIKQARGDLPNAGRVRWWWALLVAALVAEATARGAALRSGGPLDLGPAMGVLVVGQLLAIGAAVVGIAVVLGVDHRRTPAAAALARDAGRE
jgi:hypothetical protein